MQSAVSNRVDGEREHHIRVAEGLGSCTDFSSRYRRGRLPRKVGDGAAGRGSWILFESVFTENRDAVRVLGGAARTALLYVREFGLGRQNLPTVVDSVGGKTGEKPHGNQTLKGREREKGLGNPPVSNRKREREDRKERGRGQKREREEEKEKEREGGKGKNL